MQKSGNYLNKRTGIVLIINVAVLIAIKTATPLVGTQLATLVDRITPFDSREIIVETNKTRSAFNLAPLEANAQLDLAASDKLNDMTVKNYFGHISPQGVNPWFWVEKNNYNYTHAGENLALGFFTAESTVSAWMNSPSHRANVINPKYQEIGVATSKATINGVAGTLVVQMFGRPDTQVVAVKPVLTQNPEPEPTQITPPKQSSPSPAIQDDSNVAGSDIQNNLPQAPNNANNLKNDPIKLQYVSTDTDIPPVSEPSESVTASNLPDKLNNLYQFYLSVILVALMGIILFNGLSKRVALATAVNLSLLFVSFITPTTVLTAKILIF